MAEEVPVVVCEVLCFLRKNYDKHSSSHLKGVIVGFYNEDELMRAKDILLKATLKAAESMDINLDLPRMPNRRQGDKKCPQTTDDIIKLMSVVDERNLYDALPRFVAEDLSRIPFIDADSTSLIAILRKMEAFEQRMTCVEQSINNKLDSRISHNLSRDAAQPPDTYCEPTDTTADDGEQWVTVARRGIDKSGNGTSKPGLSSHSSTRQPSQGVHRANHSTVNNRKILGTRQGSDTSVKSGVTIIQKSVMHVDNLHPDCTPALLKDYLLAADVNVLTCHSSKSWLREGERDQVTAFRLCVPASQRHKIFDPQLWSEGVVIRDWKFKKSNHGAGVSA